MICRNGEQALLKGGRGADCRIPCAGDFLCIDKDVFRREFYENGL
jgi:hypothetical protein